MMRGWIGIAIYFIVSCCSLAGVGYGVTKFFEIRTNVVLAQPQPNLQPAPNKPGAEALPAPEDIPIGDNGELPEAPEEEVSQQSTPESKPLQNLGILEGIIEQYEYQGANKRDPFAPFIVPRVQNLGAPAGPVTELERYELEQLRLVGIIWGVSKPKALFLDPNQKTYVVFNKTRIGRNSGYIAEIREGEVVIIEAFNNEGRYSYQPRIIKLQRE